jgi:hypothetical protein
VIRGRQWSEKGKRKGIPFLFLFHDPTDGLFSFLFLFLFFLTERTELIQPSCLCSNITEFVLLICPTDRDRDPLTQFKL